MKTRNLISLAVILVSALALTFTSCQKDNLDMGAADPTSLKQLAADENEIEGIMNDTEGDITSVITNSGTGLKSSEWKPCGTTVDSLAVAHDTVTLYINYDGKSCNNKHNRTGKIEIKMKAGSHWGTPGFALTYKFINFTSTRTGNNKKVTLNGTKTIVNVSGGTRWIVGTLIDSYVERVSGTMQATFENGATRTWNVARQITWTGTPGQFNMTIDGFGSAGDYQNLVVWGTNRQGEEFFTQITQSVVCKQTCDWNPVSGIKIHQVPTDSKSATVTFGFNDNNEPVTGDNCPTRYRMDWQKDNKSGTSYLPL
jgi:hypothetical protein